MASIDHTVLHSWHTAHGAKMTEFAGWEMPLHYGSILAEHDAVRNHAGLFDTCHMTRIRVSGADRIAFLDSLIPSSLDKIPLNGVGYSFFCDERGGVLDDITIYKAEDYLLIVANASNRRPINELLKESRGKFAIEIEDVTESLCMLAYQGPLAEGVLQSITTSDLKPLRYYRFTVMQSSGARVLISRTGYTGEDGFEIYCGSLYARMLWERILSAGKPSGTCAVGLGARDILRLEASMPLYGHELTLETTPIEAGLEKYVDFEKKAFRGRLALMHSTSSEFTRRLICFEMLDDAIPRANCRMLVSGMSIGKVTSGAFSPTLKRGIGMGYIAMIHSEPGASIEIEIHGKPHPAQIVKKPFYRRKKQ